VARAVPLGRAVQEEQARLDPAAALMEPGAVQGRAGRVEKAGPAVAAPGAPVETADHLLVSRWSGMLRLRVRGLPIIWGMRAHRDRVVQALHRVQAVAREQQADAGIKGWWLIRVSIRGG
jgi:hypothetical protein